MNWKEQAHLFANGKFKISLEKYTSIKNDVWDFMGVYDGELMLERGKVDQRNNTFEHEQLDPEKCQLLARPIADMSDEELEKYPVTYGDGKKLKGDQIWVIEREANENRLLGRCERYLQSIGIYHGPQSHFETGEVLNIN